MDYEEDVYVDILDEGPVDRDDHGDYKGKGIAESSEFERWDGGSVSGDNDSDHYYSRYRSESRDYDGSRSYKHRSVADDDLEDFSKRYRHEAGDKGRSLSSRCHRETESDEEEKEEQFSRRHNKHGPGDKEHNRNYRRRQVFDDDNSDEEAGEEQFTGKLIMHESKGKEHKRNYRRRRVVDDDYSEEEAEEEHITRKIILHGSGDKEHNRSYRRRRVVDDDFSDEKTEEELITRKLNTHGSGDKELNRNYRCRQVVDDDYSDEEREEEERFTRKLCMHGSGDKQHSRNSKRRRVVDDDYSDDEFKLVAKCSKECDDSGGHDRQSGRILSHRRSNSRDGKMSEDHIDRDRSRHRDGSHARKRGHHQDRNLKLDRERREYDVYMKKRGGDAEEDNYKRRPTDIRHSTRYPSEHDDDDDDWEREREIIERERDYDYTKERRRNAKEEKYDRRRHMHHSTRYQSEHDDDDDWERERSYDYMKDRGVDSEEDVYNRRPRDMRQSTRYQGERDDVDSEREITERERDSWERCKEMKDNSYEMKHMKRGKYQVFRGNDKECLMRTRNRDLIERGKERDVPEPGGECLEESQEINWQIESRKGRREMNSVKRDLRIQITEAKEKSHQREPIDGGKEKDSREHERQSLESSLKWELEERQKERDFGVRDRECKGNSKEIQQSKDSKGGSWKLNFAETTRNKRERETTGKSCEREKIHKVIRKKDLIERDIMSIEDSHVKERHREMREIIPKRDFRKIDSRKQDMGDGMQVIKETDLENHNRGSREVSQEIEWDRKTRQRYQKTEFMDRDKWYREGRQNASERGGISRLNERLVRKPEQENNDECQEREFGKEGRETIRRRVFVERDTWKPDIKFRETCLETEIMHKENERDLMTRDVDRKQSQQEELLNKVEEKRRRDCDKISHEKTLEDESVDKENEIDIMTQGMNWEKSQQKEILNKEEEKRQREGDQRNREKTLENGSMDDENEGNLRMQDNGSWKKGTETTEGETIRELHDEKEKCREHGKETKEEQAEADAGTESERQRKTVFAYQISTGADDRDVYNFFSKAGKVRDVRLVMDPISGLSIGVGYVEFYHAMSIPIAVSLSGELLHGQPVMVKPPEADNNQAHSTKNAVGGELSSPCPGGSNRLCVGDVHDSITEALLCQVFEAFGAIELVQLASAETGHCERSYIIHFARVEDARAALSLNGHLALVGQLIKVSPINNHEEEQRSSADTDCRNEVEGNDLASDFVVQDEMLGSDAKKILSNEEEGSGMAPDGQSESALQESDPCGVEQNNDVLSNSSPVTVDCSTLPSESLAHLVPPSIQAFAASLKAVLQVPGAAIPIVDTVGVPSECLLLKNMFNSNMQTADDIELRVKEDVEEKCYKFGKPKEIHIDKNSAGCVYLRFEDIKTAIVAHRTLHGRWFSGKMITATYMVPQIYNAKFPNTEQALAQGPPPPAWLPYDYGASNPISGQTLAQGPTPAVWLPQTYGSSFPSGQQPLASGSTSAMWVPNNNPVAFGAGFGNGGQFMQPLVPQGNIFPDMRPNIWQCH
ncbi:unnamed protein product [Rhodiola kirilowii]